MTLPLAAIRDDIPKLLALLRQPSEADQTLRLLLADRFHAEKQMAQVTDWLTSVQGHLDGVQAQYEAQIADLERRIAELEARPPSPAVIAPAPKLSPVEEITGHARLRAVE